MGVIYKRGRGPHNTTELAAAARSFFCVSYRVISMQVPTSCSNCAWYMK